jgi:hypothetical protein
MKYLKSYKLFEMALGIAEATLIYNQFLTDEFMKSFQKFKEEDVNTNIKDKTREYSETFEYSKEDLSEFIKSDIWQNFPVSEMTITYTTKVMPDELFQKRFPSKDPLNKRLFVNTGACYSIGKKDDEGSYVIEPIDDRSEYNIHLKLEIGTIISDVFTDDSLLSVDIESTITHELNHAYEGWNRNKSNKGQLSTDLTFALDVNRARIKKEIWKIWYDEIGFYLYWSERHEINAMVQEALPYVKRYDVKDMMSKSSVWKFADKMKNFKADEFKQKMIDEIVKYYPDANTDIFLKRIKNALANELIGKRDSSKLEDKPTISGERIKSMSVDKFLETIQKRINLSGEKIQRRILRLYTFEDK